MRTFAKSMSFAPYLLTLLVFTHQTTTAQVEELHVICSNGFRAAIQKLRPQSEHSIGRHIQVEFGASANLRRTIESGEPFDVAILTPQILGELTNEGKIVAGSTVQVASTGIGIAVRAGTRKPDVSTAQAVKQALLSAKSVGYVQVGAGTPAKLSMLLQLGIEEDVQKKTVYQSGADQAMQNISGGKIEIAFGLISEILTAPGVQLAGPLPPEFQQAIFLSGGIATATRDRAAAEAFLRSLASADAERVIRSVGMSPVSRGRDSTPQK